MSDVQQLTSSEMKARNDALQQLNEGEEKLKHLKVIISSMKALGRDTTTFEEIVKNQERQLQLVRKTLG